MNKEAYQQKLQAKLDEWSAEIDKLKAKADGASADAKIELDKQLAKLRPLQEAAAQKLAELKKAGDDAWQDIQQAADKTRASIEEGIKTLRSKFQ